MANPNPKLSSQINQLLKAQYKKFEKNYPEGIGLAKMMQGEQIMKNEFIGVLQNCPIQYLQNKEFRSAIQNPDGLTDMGRAMFSMSVHEVFIALGLEI